MLSRKDLYPHLFASEPPKDIRSPDIRAFEKDMTLLIIAKYIIDSPWRVRRRGETPL